eukprot:gene18990-biopygen12024
MFHLASEYGDFSLIWQVIGAAYQLAFDKNHGQGGPAGPHLQGIALAPLAEVIAVRQVV